MSKNLATLSNDLARVRASDVGQLSRAQLCAFARPVILEGLFDDCPARIRWSPAYLAAALGDREVPVEYSLRPIFHPRPQLNEGRYFRKLMPFDAVLGRIGEQPRCRSWQYLSSLSLAEYAPELVADLIPPRISGGPPWQTALFIGHDGSGTYLHYDTTDNLMVIFSGAKRTLLIAPAETPKLRPFGFSHSCNRYSSLRPTDPERGTLALPEDVPCCECIIEPGEALYIPSGWWHQVINVALTVGVSMIWKVPAWRRLRRQYLRVHLGHRAARWVRGARRFLTAITP